MFHLDQYRREPSAVNVDIAALGNNESSWLLLLMVEDEMARAQSTFFHIVHPTPNAASYYTTLYRSCRFSDHLLAKWVQSGGSEGEFGHLIPEKFVTRESKTAARTLKSSNERGDRIRSSYGQGYSSSPSKAVVESSPDVKKTPRPLSAGRSMSRLIQPKQQLPATPITLNVGDLQLQNTELQLQPPPSQQNHLRLSLGRDDMNYLQYPPQTADSRREDLQQVHTSNIPDVLADRLSSFGFKPMFVDSPASKKQSYIVFDGNLVQSARAERHSTELSTEIIMNFVDTQQQQHHHHLHSRSPKEDIAAVHFK